jgi:mgtE-like transporter
VGVVQTLSVSLYLAVLAKGAAVIFGLPSASFLDLAVISVVAGVLSSAVILALTVALSVVSFRRGYDLDTVATPLIMATGDMVSVPLIFAATFLTDLGWLTNAVGVACVVAGVAALARGARTSLRPARRILAESIPVLVLTPVLDIAAGTVLDHRLDEFLELPGLLVVIPPLVSNAGALGGILSSRLSSKLQIGLISPRRFPEPPALVDTGLMLGFGLVVFSAVGLLGYLFSSLAHDASPSLEVMVGATLLAGMLATLLAVVAAYYIAVLATRVGLDPDNHSVPIISSSMDLAGVVLFLLVLSLWGLSYA